MVKFKTPQGMEISEDALNEIAALQFDVLKSSPSKTSFELECGEDFPKNFQELETRFFLYEERLRECLFGFAHKLGLKKTIKKVESLDTIVDCLTEYEKIENKVNVYNEQFNPLQLINVIIEKNLPFMICKDKYILGIERDRSGLSVPEQNRISFQVAAQILWAVKKNEHPTIESMIDCLEDEQNPFYLPLKVDRFNNPRTIRNWISEVFPIPKKERKRRLSDEEASNHYFDVLVPVPGIFMEGGSVVNFVKLKFGLEWTVQILKILKWSDEQIRSSNFVEQYRGSLTFYLPMYVDLWVDGALRDNGRIFG